MGAPDTIPDLQYQKPDGSPFTRLEMEQQMREVWPKVHWLRIKANKIYGLPKQPSFDMKEAVLRHWVLDEMVRRAQIIGDQVGVNVQSYNDDNEHRQFIQRLTAMIQAGQAHQPKEGEGVDMSNVPVPPPPPVSPNGQSHGFAPPAPPMGAVPQGYAPPAGPPGFAPPAPPFAPPGVAAPPGMAPPVAPQGFAPQGPPQGFAPAPPMMPPGMQQPPMPPGYPQQAAQPPQQQQFAAPAPPAPAAAPAPGGRGGRSKKQQDAAPAQPPPPAAPVPPMQGFAPQQPQQMGFPQMPQAGGFPQAGFPQAGFAPQQQPQAPAPQQQVAQPQAAGVDLGPILAKVDALAGLVTQQAQIIANLGRQVQVLSMGAALTLRVAYGKQGDADMVSILKEIIPGFQVPQ